MPRIPGGGAWREGRVSSLLVSGSVASCRPSLGSALSPERRALITPPLQRCALSLRVKEHRPGERSYDSPPDKRRCWLSVCVEPARPAFDRRATREPRRPVFDEVLSWRGRGDRAPRRRTRLRRPRTGVVLSCGSLRGRASTRGTTRRSLPRLLSTQALGLEQRRLRFGAVRFRGRNARAALSPAIVLAARRRVRSRLRARAALSHERSV